ncbi:MAG: DUF2950 domain-containing protein [Planctomycetes bacterium]|nr:DUF2950 domain-containing protein [Planctomycetota bacterium]
MNADSERLKRSETRIAPAPPAASARWSLAQRVPWFLLGALALIAWFVFARLIPQLLRTRSEANESAAVAACKTYAEAQDIYRRTDWDSDGVLEYKQTLRAVGPRLFEGAAGFGDLDLVDDRFIEAEGDPGTAVPKAGYVFKVLKAQGPHAPGGAFSYVEPGADSQAKSAHSMTHGYALAACPAVYSETGRHTFVVAHYGVVYKKDLGPDTVKLYLSMDTYDPDETWRVAE